MRRTRPVPCRVPLWRACVLALGLGVSAGALAEDLAAKVKAAYLFHLTKFVEWPSAPAGQEFRICLYGADLVATLMGDLGNRPVRDAALKVLVEPGIDPGQCQILYVGQDDRRLPDLLRRVRSEPVLTVSDKPEFARQGGMVGFYPEAGKIKLEINPDAARAARLRLSAKLLGLARTVP